jgi:cell wall-associated NlpC family hydrolase
VPSNVLNVELPAASDAVKPTASRYKLKTRLAALALAGAAGVTLGACSPPSGGSSSAVAIAAEHAGQPYVYGAAGPSSFDCSGFTEYVYQQLGVSLPHSAAGQQSMATPIARGSEQPGDLIFFGSPAYHVGIYAGNGQLWYAPHTGDVVKLGAIWDSSYTVGRVGRG